MINGSKTFITNGLRADFIVLVTKTDPDEGARRDHACSSSTSATRTARRFPASASPRKLEKMGMHASDTGELAFEDVRVPVENLLGEEGKGFYHISWELQGERLVAAAGCVAGAERMFERTLEYAKEREAFGRPIGKLPGDPPQVRRDGDQDRGRQAVHLRDRLALRQRRVPGPRDLRRRSSTPRGSREVADECIQIHGGYGYMKEYEIERAYRDVRLNRIGAGTDEIMLEVIGRSYGL